VNDEMLDVLSGMLNREVEKRHSGLLTEIETLKAKIQDLTGGFEIGKGAWTPLAKKTAWLECNLCRNGWISTIFMDERDEIKCPKCNYYGKPNNGKYSVMTYVPHGFKVRQVGYKNAGATRLTIWSDEGREFDITDVFTTEEACMDKCAELNNNLCEKDYTKEVEERALIQYFDSHGISGLEYPLCEDEFFKSYCQAIMLSSPELKEHVKKYLEV